MANVIVLGGAGYVGSLLCPQLLEMGHAVTCYDIGFFGTEFLPLTHPRFRLVKADIRDASKVSEALKGQDIVIHLACISNDASFDLDASLSESINYHSFEPTVKAARAAGVSRFIFASSASVYGLSDLPNVTEDHPLRPLTLYSKFKGMCEDVLLKYNSDEFCCVAIRPATLCGYAPRLRLDLTVNILTNHAVNARKIKVFGGAQLRPNLHIQDMCDLYKLLLDAPRAAIAGKVFNVGFENMAVSEIARRVQGVVAGKLGLAEEIQLETTPTNDNRSYHINSAKIRDELQFVPRFGIENAIAGLCDAFGEGLVPDGLTSIKYQNVKTLIELKAK